MADIYEFKCTECEYVSNVSGGRDRDLLGQLEFDPEVGRNLNELSFLLGRGRVERA